MGLLTLGFAVCPLVQGREGRLLSGRLAVAEKLAGNLSIHFQDVVFRRLSVLWPTSG